MKYYAVIDTNVIVSALLSQKEGVATKRVWEYIFNGTIIPLINTEILTEYTIVLHREQFRFDPEPVETTLDFIKTRGIMCEAVPAEFNVIDPADVVFYEVSLSREDAYLITGNRKHFPKSGRIVSPAEMVQIIELSENSSGILNDPDIDYMTEKKKKTLQEEKAFIERARQITEMARKNAIANGTADMSMEEIIEEIRLARLERRAQLAEKKD